MKWKKLNINQVSTVLSILCVIDCTVLPVVLFLLSIFNILEDKIYIFHELSEKIALYIMAPISSCCILMNFYQLRNYFLLLWGIFAMALFIISHGHFQCFGEQLDSFIHQFHIPLSLLSVILIISNNFVSQKILKDKNLHSCCSSKERRSGGSEFKSTISHQHTGSSAEFESEKLKNLEEEREHESNHNHDDEDDQFVDRRKNNEQWNYMKNTKCTYEHKPNMKDKDKLYKNMNKSETELISFLNN